MSDFEPGYSERDISLGYVGDFDESLATQDERDAIAFSELFARSYDERYFSACIFAGVNPLTQEPWTEDEVAEHIDKEGFDPRNVADWLKRDEEIDATARNYLETKGYTGDAE